ncbi:MAG: hypothetical protein ACRDPF_14500, partial [Streptosporangiaceae bacterium]
MGQRPVRAGYAHRAPGRDQADRRADHGVDRRVTRGANRGADRKTYRGANGTIDGKTNGRARVITGWGPVITGWGRRPGTRQA